MKFSIATLLLALTFTYASGSFSQDIVPTPDSCLIILDLKSNDSIPYPDKTVLFIENDSINHKSGITDNEGVLKQLLKKSTDYQILIFEGVEQVWSGSIKTPDNNGLVTFKYSILIDIFTEDKENETFIVDQFSQQDTLAPSDSLVLVNVTLNNKDNEPIANTSVLFRDSVTKVIYIGQTNARGKFQILLPKGADYGIRLIQNGNRLPFDNLSTRFGEGEYTQTLNLQYDYTEENYYYEKIGFASNISDVLSEKILPESFILENIYFDFDKAVLRSISYPELLKFSKLLKTNKKIVIEIEGHTDSFGDYDYNQQLSERRANSVMNFLIETGISPLRMSAIGYGELRPIATNETDEGRQQNRRTEIKVIEQ